MKIRKYVKLLIIIMVAFLFNITPVYASEGIDIKSVTISEQSSTIGIDDFNFSDNVITSSIAFNEVNDFVTFDVEVVNNTNISYVLDSISNNINSDYLVIESEDVGSTINKKTTQIIKVKIKYNNELQNQNDISLRDVSFGLVFKNPTHLINPFTGNLILVIMFVLVLSILIFYTVKNKKVAALLLVMVFLLALVPFYTKADEGVNVNLSFKDISIKARYLQYRVQLNNTNEVIRESTITFGEPIGELPEVTKPGYDFEGWKDQDDNKVTEDTIVTQDLVLEPDLNVINYNIVYILNGSTLEEENQDTYTVEDEFTLNNPEKEGYTFQGWSSDSGETYQTSVTISKGTIGDMIYEAYFSANPDTLYKVIHNKMNINGEYEQEEVEELHGATGTEVTPQPRDWEGFIKPAVQTKEIDGSGGTIFTYNYAREKYQFTITDRTNIDQTSTPNGEYYYGTEITAKATAREGYEFTWSDGNKELERTFTLTATKTLTPNYVPNENTTYKVVHKQMNLDGETYSTKEEVTLHGKTDSEVEPNPNIYEGFTTPAKQKVKIKGDGTTVVEYKYARNKYQLTLQDDEYIETTTPTGKYFYGTEITLKAKNKSKYDFVKWSNDNTSKQITFPLRADTTIGPIYKEINRIVTLNVNGGEELLNNQISVEAEEPIGELPEVVREGYYLEGWYTAIHDGSPVTSDYVPADDMEIFAIWKVSIESAILEEDVITLRKEFKDNIVITNADSIEEGYTFTSLDESVATVNQTTGEVTGIGEGTTKVIITGTKSNKTKEVTINVTDNDYVIKFNASGGTATHTSIIVEKGHKIGTLPTAEKTNYYLDGWYIGLDSGNKITEDWYPDRHMEVYAKWKVSVEAAEIEKTDISIVEMAEKTIEITNADEIEEPYTFKSANKGIASVDQNGKITAISHGTTTITITGTVSNKQKVINVTVTESSSEDYVIVYDANEGLFETGNDENRLTYTRVNKYSHTQNVDDTGYQLYEYGDYWGNGNISGTDKTPVYSNSLINSSAGTASSYDSYYDVPNGASGSSHVISFPGAEELVVDLYYDTESCDYVTVEWEEDPSYLDLSTASSEEINGNGNYPFRRKFSGDGYNYYTINGVNINGVYHERLVLKTDTVEFSFYSDSSGNGDGYGYYAIVSAASTIGDYLEPTKDGLEFLDWYKDPELTQVFNVKQDKHNMRVYAGYGHIVTYNANGGSIVGSPTKKVLENRPIGSSTAPTRYGYYLDSWTDEPDGGVEIPDSYVPDSNLTLFARWKKSIKSANVDNDSMIIETGTEVPIAITNIDEVEEDYTVESSDTSIIQVVDSNKIKGIKAGETTVTLVGVRSGQRKEISITATPKYTYTYNANGGEFSDGSTRNIVTTREITKYSHTENVDKTGKKLDDYGDSWNNSNIRGTNRTTAEDAPHVVTIPGATQIVVDIYYNGESTSYDYVKVEWEEGEPSGPATASDYSEEPSEEPSGPATASDSGDSSSDDGSDDNSDDDDDDYEDEIATSGSTRYRFSNSSSSSQYIKHSEIYGGQQYSTYVLNGNTLYNMGHDQIVIPNDTVSFSFVSDGGGRGDGYGYYAVITALNVDGNYKEPSKSGTAKFLNWYKDADCTQLFNPAQDKQDMSLYAGYGYTVTFSSGYGANPSSKDVIEYRPIGTLATASRSGYYLDGWTREPSGGTTITEDYIPDSNMTVYARWKTSVGSGTLNKTSVTLDKNQEETIYFTNASSIEEDYTFTSNNENVVTVDENGKLKAQGEGTTTVTIRGVISGHTKTVNVTVYYARYVVTVNENNSSSTVYRKIVSYEDTIGELIQPFNSHKEFLGWYTSMSSGTLVDASTVVTSDRTIYARWGNTKSYTITYDANGGSVSSSTKTVYYDSQVGTLATPTRSGYTFLGWKDETENKYYQATTIPTKNVTLKAQWGTGTNIARINSTIYSTFASALSAAQSGDEIVIISTSSSYQTAGNITIDKDITLNLNGTSYNGQITIAQGANVKILNGTITANTSSARIINNGTLTLGNYTADNSLGITISTTYSTTKAYAITNNGTLIINSGSISSAQTTYNYDTFTIYGTGDVIMNNGSVSASAGSSGIASAITAKNVTINKGSISSNGNYAEKGINATGNVNINGGTITVTTSAPVSSGPYGIIGNKIVITGGTISSTSNGSKVAYGIKSTQTAEVYAGTIKVTTSSSSYSAYGSYSGFKFFGGNVYAYNSSSSRRYLVYNGTNTYPSGKSLRTSSYTSYTQYYVS